MGWLQGLFGKGGKPPEPEDKGGAAEQSQPPHPEPLPPPKVEELLAQGQAQLQFKFYQGALQSFELVIGLEPGCVEAWQGKAAALKGLQRYGEANAALEKAMELQTGPQNATANPTPTTLQPSQPASWDSATASAGNREAVFPNAASETDWYQQGDDQLMAGNYQAAIDNFDRALQHKPDHHEAWYNRGNALGNLGRYEEAINSYDRALQHKPDKHEAWYNRGNALGNLGRYEEAINSYDQALQHKPDKHEAWYNRGVTLDDLGRYEEAINSYDQALQHKPDCHEAWNNRGVTLGDLGRYEEAIDSHDRALQHKPDKHEAWNNRGVTLGDLGCYEEAINSYDRALQHKPDHHEAWNNRGVALGNLGRYEEAINSYDRALQHKPDYHLAWINRGMAAGNSTQCLIPVVSYRHWTPAMRNADLDQRGYLGELASYHEGLKYVLREPNPLGWGALHRVLGTARYFRGKREASPFPLWRAVAKDHNLALGALTKDAFPEDRLAALKGIIQVYLALGHTEPAWGLVQEGSELLQRLIAISPSPGKRTQLARKFSSLDQLAVDTWVQRGNPLAALQTAERAKNSYLAWLVGNPDEFDYPLIQRTLLNAHTAALYWHLSPYALTCFWLTPDHPDPQIHPVSPSQDSEGQAQEHRPDTLPDAVRRLEKWETWLKDWNESYQDYRDTADGTAEHSWRTDMPTRLAHLRALLEIPALEAKLTEAHITHLLLLPHRDLHRFPLHALFDQSFTCSYLPSLEVGVILQGYSPVFISPDDAFLSVENPKHEQTDDTGTSKKLLALPFAEVESALLCHKFTRPAIRLGNTAATEAAVLEILTRKTIPPSPAAKGGDSESSLLKGVGGSLLHFTGHGAYNFSNPADPGLFLSGKDRLTVATLRRLKLGAIELVALNACETAVTGNQTVATEYVGLVSAFLQAGVRQVLSTLWTVQSESSALFMVEFYNQLLGGTPAPQALHHTQVWLQTATRDDWKIWIDRELAHIAKYPKTLQIQESLEDCRDRLKTLEAIPYRHPYHWAAFILSGGL